MTFYDRLIHFAGRKAIEGCSDAEIDELQKRFNVVLPSEYTTFLKLMGKNANGLWTGSDYRFEKLPSLQEAAVELVSAVPDLTLPDGAFVFYMHQGYQFFFFVEDAVLYFIEGAEEFEKRFDSFSEFFDAFRETRV